LKSARRQIGVIERSLAQNLQGCIDIVDMMLMAIHVGSSDVSSG